jgi:positive regulator of sigma E activity
MKPSIPDTGTVISLEGEKAVVRMKHEGSCSKCGAAAMGLCKAGLMQVLTVKNTERARVGDTVKIGLVQRTQYTGYVLAYVVPSAALVLGMVGGHFLGIRAGFPPLDIIAGFFSLLVVSFFSLRQLKRLDSSSSIEIVSVLSDPWSPGALRAAEETKLDHFFSYC